MPEIENMKKEDSWSLGWLNFSEISLEFLSILSLNLQNQQAYKVKKWWYAQMKDKKKSAFGTFKNIENFAKCKYQLTSLDLVK